MEINNENTEIFACCFLNCLSVSGVNTQNILDAINETLYINAYKKRINYNSVTNQHYIVEV